MREPREPATTDQYERPQQAWICGLAAEGAAPCPAGPGAHGGCPAAAACHPVRDGDRWHCNRSNLRGGPCEGGPSHDGACSIVYRCTPIRSLRTRRGRFIVGITVAALGGICMVLSGAWRNEILAPGLLSVHHAQLLQGKNVTLRCAQCHAAGEATLAAWWADTVGTEELTPTQSLLCMECHKETLSAEFALAAHGVDLHELEERTKTREGRGVAGDANFARFNERRRDPAEAIACSACHREHQGRLHDLTAISNVACQACHRQEFDSFAGNHPDFGSWPYQRRTRIAFDHASHQLKHFPEEKQEFACAACHQADATGERILTADYAASCAACHDKSIATSLVDGLPLVALPTVDVDALTEAGHDIGDWPAAATGDFEGAPPAAAKLLMLADSNGAAALGVLGGEFDLYDVDIDDATQLRAAAQTAEALRGVIDDLATQGQGAIADRIKRVLGRDLTPQELDGLAGRLSPDAAQAYRDELFGAGAADATRGGAPTREEFRNQVAAGGWFRDGVTMSLRYRPIGHADPWMRAWLDVLAEGASGSQGKLIEPLLLAAMKPTAPGQCGSCHSLDRDAGRFVIQWGPLDVEHEQRGFTRFNHAPHVMQPKTGDCASCHRVAVGAEMMASYAGRDPHRFAPGFEPMSKASCAACHTAAAAGDSCTQCHQYHGGKNL